MRVPFQTELDEVFRSDHSLWLKMAGSSFVSIFVVVGFAIQGIRQGRLDFELTTSLILRLTVVSGFLGASLSLLLALKDTIQRRIDRGDPVNPLLRLYFARARLSLFVWFVSALFGSMFLMMIGFMLGIF